MPTRPTGRSTRNTSEHAAASDLMAESGTPLARLIDTAMRAHGYTLKEVARRSGVKQSTVGAYKTGRITGQRANRERLVAVATALDLNVETVLAAAGAPVNASDEATLLKLFRRLPTPEDRVQAVETLRIHARLARERSR